MGLDVLVTSERWSNDPNGRELIEFLINEQEHLKIENGVAYYDFPTYGDYDGTLHRPHVILFSPRHGLVVINIVTGGSAAQNLETYVEEVNEISSLLITRLLKSRLLRSNISNLSFSVSPILLIDTMSLIPFVEDDSCYAVTSLEGLKRKLKELSSNTVSDEQLLEVRSILEGAKALSRQQRRKVQNSRAESAALALIALEDEISNFDQKQRKTALVTITGAQRIRGLAGSGKTVILAMKAANIHLNQPDAQILFTYYTKALKGTIKNLISRFYRHYKDEDANWDVIHVRHGWGGRNIPGVYTDAARRANQVPMDLREAQSRMPKDANAFDFACRELLRTQKIEGYYDHVLIDEGQDFHPGFYELCWHIARGPRDKKNIIWAYDELQNIMDVTLRSPEELFGIDTDGEPRVSLSRVSGYPPGSSNDEVLSKCYRNQRKVLVAAHALGFGIYGNIVQLLESPAHWRDVGYEVPSKFEKEFPVGSNVRITRPVENSPISLSEVSGLPLIDWKSFESIEDEVRWASNEIQKFIKAGLQPEDVIVIALDDRNARSYLKSIAEILVGSGIVANNIIADPYADPTFTQQGAVTLSTVYRAKGNEAALVIAVGIDAIERRSRSGRNKIFTAFTRSKGWLRVSGMGKSADIVFAEIEKAINNFPELRFKMPDLSKVDFIQRDLSEKAQTAKKLRDEYLKKLRAAGLSEEEAADLAISFDTSVRK